MSNPPSSMQFTGERFTPETHGDIEVERVHRYMQACKIAVGRDVLDIACREGYGSSLLAGCAKSVIGVDASAETIERARHKQPKPNLDYRAGDCAAIPLPDASIDLVVSFETIELHDQHDKMISEIKRVLRPDGILFMSSPDKQNGSIAKNFNNPFPVRELSEDEFKNLVRRNFKNAVFFAQRVIGASGIFRDDDPLTAAENVVKTNGVEVGAGGSAPEYWVCLASDGEIPTLASGVFQLPIEKTAILKSYQDLVQFQERKLADQARKYAELERQFNEVDDKLTSLVRSTSWLITKPIRFFARTFLPSSLRRLIRKGRGPVIDSQMQTAAFQLGNPAVKYQPAAPAWSMFEALAAKQGKPSAQPEAAVDVIIPVYRGYADTFACIHSVLVCHNMTPFEIVVIDDCSPEPAISEDLRRLAKLGLITLIANKTNLGFVGSVNAGMALHADRDVILLNSDTLVFHDWLDRLKNHAVGSVATVTPFTNNGTICSYPRFCRDNPEPLETSYDQLDALASKVNAGQVVDIPTAVGFCMYITRRSLDDVGLFDAEAFGKGYGEENDFCMRVFHRGYRNVHALDIFVFHSGEVSFAGSAAEAKQKNYEVLTKKHPDYHEMVHAFIAHDPACHARTALDVGRALGQAPSATRLLVAHSWGGGIQRYIDDRADEFRKEKKDLIVVIPSEAGATDGKLIVNFKRLDDKSRLNFNCTQAEVEFLFTALKIDAIEIHSTAGWSSRVLDLIPRLSQKLSIPYEIMLHDYIPICPQIHLVNESKLYCGEEGPSQCAACLSFDRTAMYHIHPDLKGKPVDVLSWRALYRNFLNQAIKVMVPSNDTAVRLKKYFPEISFVVVPHVETPPRNVKPPAAFRPGSRLRIAVIGKLSVHKGFDVIHRVAADIKRRNLPIDYLVFGGARNNRAARRQNILVTGEYRESEIYDLLNAGRVNAVFLPSVWPETYSYTLSIALEAGLPVIAFDLGAQAERLRGNKRALLLPLEMANHPQLINEEVIRFTNSLVA